MTGLRCRGGQYRRLSLVICLLLAISIVDTSKLHASRSQRKRFLVAMLIPLRPLAKAKDRVYGQNRWPVQNLSGGARHDLALVSTTAPAASTRREPWSTLNYSLTTSRVQNSIRATTSLINATPANERGGPFDPWRRLDVHISDSAVGRHGHYICGHYHHRKRCYHPVSI